jgi:hypothetical protein
MHTKGLSQADTGGEMICSMSQGIDGETRKEHQGKMWVKSPEGFRDVEPIVFAFEEPISQEYVRGESLADRHGILGISGYAYVIAAPRQNFVHHS